MVYVCVHTHTHTHACTMEYYSAIEKNENFAICNIMDGLGEGIMLGQTEKDKYCMISLICGI